MMYRASLLLAGITLLAACAGSDTRSEDDESIRQQSELNTQLGREYMRRGQYEIALEKLKKAVSADPGYAPAHTVLAVLYEQIGEAELAGQHYRRAVEAAPANGDVNNNYGAFLCHSGQAGQAESYFLKAASDPFYRTPAVAYANAGSCLLQSGNLDKAESYLRQSLEYDAKFPDALLAMAHVNHLLGNYFRARAFLQRYEDFGPDTAASLALGSQIETGLSNADGAREYLERLFSGFPESPQATDMMDNSQK